MNICRYFFLIIILLTGTAGYSQDWYHTGGLKIDRGEGITLDNQNNLLTTGSFSDSVDFDPGPGIFNLIARRGLDQFGGDFTDAFVEKTDGNGKLLWVKQIGIITH